MLGLVFLRDSLDKKTDTEAFQVRVEMVRSHGLTDLCLFTEARYTRHPSQADFHSPFQDSPLSLEHFPSGSLLGSPHQAGKNR
ncbi:MAG: hypothetical protein HY892_07560 [Deltaproteobacteria bacterium]|nr:hypothetical protein [Deltaproteobacteria bacterium]